MSLIHFIKRGTLKLQEADENKKSAERRDPMTDETFHYKDYRSGQLVNGLERSAHRALLYSTGLEEEDLGKPMIGIVNSYTDLVPGHIELKNLVESVKLGIAEAGGVSREFSTIAICDGVCQGHVGMRYPLPSRELIADSVEYMAEAHQLDGLVLMPGCDKIVPGMLMAAVRLNIPAIVLPAGPMLPGKVDGETYTLTDMRELVGRVQTGKMSPEELKKIEREALPGSGTCAMLGTANTMCCLAETLGMTLPGAGLSHAVTAKKKRLAKSSGRRIVEMVKEDLRPRRIITRDSLLNGIRCTMAMGASTNSTLHLPAIAHEAGIDLSFKDFDEISRQIPYICNVKPSGKYPLIALEECGGVGAVLKAIEPKLNTDCLTVNGRTLGENLADVASVENDVLFSLAAPKKPEGGLAILYGNLAPEGAVVKQAGVKPSMYYFEGRARVFTGMEEASEAVSNDRIKKGDVIVIRYEGPKGGPGMREMHMTTALLVGRGMDEDCALITDGRFSGSTRGPCIGYISPEAAAGGPIAAVEEGDKIIIDIPNRKLTLCVSEEELAARLKKVVPLKKPATPALARYAYLVTSANRGAVLEIPEEK